jgi:hypothetical protein
MVKVVAKAFLAVGQRDVHKKLKLINERPKLIRL